MDNIRIGHVSRIDYEKGMIAVAYLDRDNSVTKLMPYLQLGGEYHMPKVEQRVAVLHLSSGMEFGIILGPFWDATTPPPQTGKDVFHKELSHEEGKAYFHHDPETRTLTVRADEIILKTQAGDVIVSDLIT